MKRFYKLSAPGSKLNSPIFDKVDVNGKNTAPLYKYLKAEKGCLLIDAIKWNFTKLLISPDGKVFQRYSRRTSPLEFEKDIQTLLGQASS
ncbi:hypothetical protein DY000_02034966 [Brassica cretica]|uniref:Glutathione peroxidase n=1 Tax=Brassica cretica TaxID=69181 RepID=A0ABQ7DM05_BRACR|nr:hypothetical protein DY000_02034966 [Brassica cretica]